MKSFQPNSSYSKQIIKQTDPQNPLGVFALKPIAAWGLKLNLLRRKHFIYDQVPNGNMKITRLIAKQLKKSKLGIPSRRSTMVDYIKLILRSINYPNSVAAESVAKSIIKEIAREHHVDISQSSSSRILKRLQELKLMDSAGGIKTLNAARARADRPAAIKNRPPYQWADASRQPFDAKKNRRGNRNRTKNQEATTHFTRP